jgi:hypothetical protein
MLVVAADSERLLCGGFSLGETIHFESLEFIADCFDGLSLSPRSGGVGAPATIPVPGPEQLLGAARRQRMGRRGMS